MKNGVQRLCVVLHNASKTSAPYGWRSHWNVLFLIVFLATMIPPPLLAQAQPLFVPLPSNQFAPTSEQATRLQLVQQDPAVASVSLATLDLGGLQATPVTLALPDGNVAASWLQTITRSPTDYTWIGNMPSGGQAILVVHDGEITGHIQSGLNIYEITPIGGGVQAIAKIDQSISPPDDPDDASEPSVSPPGSRAQPEANSGTAATPTQVDILIAYTTNAKNAYGGNIVSLAQLSVDQANTAYNNSNAGVVMRLVGTMEVAYNERGNVAARNDVTNGVGVLAEVHQRRDRLGADLVSLFTAARDWCGYAWINSDQSRAYSSVRYNCAARWYTFAHEIGHNFGARHDTYVDPTNTPYAWGHGYVNPNWRFRTVMAYQNQCEHVRTLCPRVLYFSNPMVSFNQDVTGTAATNNVALVHRDRVATVAAFRNPVSLPNTHDFNNDSFSDIAFRDTSGNTAIWLMNGTTVTNSDSSFVATVPSQRAIVGQRDFNGDGKADLLWRDNSGDVAIWLMNGTTVLNPNSTFVANVPTNWGVAGTGDFNGDGFGDLLWQDTSGNVAIWLMNGTTVTNQNSSFVATVPSQWSIRGTGDFNGDGKTDILWQDRSGNVAIWLMNGTTVTNQNSSFVATVPSQWSIRGTGDFNSDRRADVLWQDTSGNVAIWLMNGITVSNQNSSFVATVPSQWSIQLTGDFNGDLKADILWQDRSGNVAIWLMNGTSVLNPNTSFVANVPRQWSIQNLGAQ
jgi:metallopeptidase family M12-like protein/VCBS repeat protein